MFVGGGLAAVNYSAYRAFKEGMHRVVKQGEGHDSILIFFLQLLRRLLEAGEHGTLAAGEMLAGVAVLAYLDENLLNNDELVRHKRVCRGKLRAVFVAFDVKHRVVKLEEVFQHGMFLVIDKPQ